MTMRKALISFFLLALAPLVLNAQTSRHIINVGDFTRLALIDDINVVYRCHADSAGLAVIECTQDVANGLMFSKNQSGRLSLQIEDEVERHGGLPTLTIYSSSLDEVENAGDSVLRVIGLPAMKAFKARLVDNGKIILRNVRASKLELQILSGKGKLIADGSCDELAVKLVGTGEIQADQVKAGTVSCRIIGTGTIGCHVLDGELKVSGSGTGKVYYKGTPSKVTVRKLGTIKAIPMDK